MDENEREEEEQQQQQQQQCVHDVAKAVANKKESGSNTTLLDWKKTLFSVHTVEHLIFCDLLRSDMRGMHEAFQGSHCVPSFCYLVLVE
ncbi:hypothetical protein OIU74_009823 [Salix koriyanagi]|uniref:Uncharacterized protein n=1 Tax=Salix koriyanagi TaxID=2511006 RepID=A0A9Q0QL80_9ROSI|nr:hypothetical protein OIU74_009823 [Salix koriyanagi]